MTRCVRILLIPALIITFMLNSSITCMGYDVLYGYANIPAEVEKGKSFTVNLQVQCNTKVSVVMFTVVHGKEIKYKSCNVNDNSCGYIEKAYNNNTLTVMYVNTKGVSAVDKVNLVDVKFEAADYTSNSNIEIFTSNAASSDELVLESDVGRVYNLEITEKITDNKPADDKKLTSNKSETATGNNNLSSAGNKRIPMQETEPETELETETETSTVAPIKKKSYVTVAGTNDAGLFIAGVIFAIAVILVVFVSYKMGKKKASSDSAKMS